MFRRLSQLNVPSPTFLSARSYRAAAGGYHGFKPRPETPTDTTATDNTSCLNTAKVQRVVQAYRDHGYQSAEIDPLGMRAVNEMKSVVDLQSIPGDTTVNVAGVLNVPDLEEASFDSVVKILEEKYCGPLSFELGHLHESPEKQWCYDVAEDDGFFSSWTSEEEQRAICGHLLRAQLMENFLGKKFPTLKRYSGEGAESMLAFFHELFKAGMESNVEELMISIPHRGRISLLTGMLDYPPSVLFHKIKGNPEFEHEKYSFIGDVISHLTSSTDLKYGDPSHLAYGDRSLHVTMVPNPSHLEASHPVVYGKTRGRQLTKGYGHYGDLDDIHKVTNIQVHGDAAIAAQGIVMETLLLESLPHFDVGGTVHLIVNNQVGFTTPQARASTAPHCSDIGKLVNCPIIHVNGDHPEEVARAARIALHYKTTFGKDIFVNMHCFRRWGHNELDDPTFTNPNMYKVINTRPTVPDVYKAKLIADGVFKAAEVEEMETEYSKFLEEEFKNMGSVATGWVPFESNWSGIRQANRDTVSVWDTGVPVGVLQQVGSKSVEVPENMTIHPHLVKTLCEARRSKLADGTKIDWATAEAMAIGSLLLEGNHVRICGQDVGRATFNHRHAMLVDQESGELCIPMNNMVEQQKGLLEIANSPLSEEAVLAYEYGLSIENPNHLCIWEAQFGDFFNGAQIIIDTFVSNGELKWLLQSGLVMLLPHGMDGAGPDHSSCKIERFLQLSDSKEDVVDGDDVNMEIVHPTTPAQYFHLLRRQLVRDYRKPLIVAAPKLILRMSAATSTLAEMTEGMHYKPIIGDTKVPSNKAESVVFCSGKYYYELDRLREKNGRDDMAIVRLESLVPFPAEELKSELQKFSNAKKFIWCQEEHRNQGAWSFVYPRFKNLLNVDLSYVGRPVLGASAIGVTKWHASESEELIKQMFG